MERSEYLNRTPERRPILCSSIQPLKDVRGIKFRDLQSSTFPGSLLFGLQYVYNRVHSQGRRHFKPS